MAFHTLQVKALESLLIKFYKYDQQPAHQHGVGEKERSGR